MRVRVRLELVGVPSGKAMAVSSSSAKKRNDEYTKLQQYNDMAGVTWQVDVCLAAVAVQIGMAGYCE